MSDIVVWLTEQFDDDEREAGQYRSDDVPDSVLRRVAAPRRILARHQPIDQPDADPAVALCMRCLEVAPCADLRDLASMYANRVGFDWAWGADG